MFHLDNNSGVSAMPPLGAVQSSAPRWFTEGGGGVPASYPGAAWFNMMQAELLNLCAAYGITPDKANLNQLKLAIEAAVSQRAPLASPAFTGVPTAPTVGQSTNNTQIATTAFVKAALAALVDSSPAALDTLNELAAALDNDPNFATTMTNALANKQAKDATLTALSGKDVAGLLTYLGLITSSDSYLPIMATQSVTIPSWASSARIRIIGAAGGGGGTTGFGGYGAGGGGGMVVEGLITGLIPGSTVQATIGAGGAPGVGSSTPTAGGKGGTTSFGTHISITGSTGGAAGAGAPGTAGGVSGTATISSDVVAQKWNGFTGGLPYLLVSNTVMCGLGGAAASVGANSLQVLSTTAAAAAGSDGWDKGIGGNGGIIGGPGGKGGDGFIEIWWMH